MKLFFPKLAFFSGSLNILVVGVLQFRVLLDFSSSILSSTFLGIYFELYWILEKGIESNRGKIEFPFWNSDATMDWNKLKNKNLILKTEKASSQIVLQPSQSSSEENEVKQSLLAICEKGCLVKNVDRKRGDSSRRVRWKDDYGNLLVQVKIYQPEYVSLFYISSSFLLIFHNFKFWILCWSF